LHIAPQESYFIYLGNEYKYVIFYDMLRSLYFIFIFFHFCFNNIPILHYVCTTI